MASGDPGHNEFVLVRRQLTCQEFDAWFLSVHDPCMAVKTITIDVEAYELLARQKRPGQSFSRVIKQRFGATMTGADLLRRAAEARISPEALDLVENVVRRRRRDLARAPKL